MRAQRRVLIVEDDAPARRMYRVALSFAGFEVVEADDGMAALRQIDQHPPDIVVLDLLLPNVSGLVVQQEIAAHAHTRNIPIVVVTGSDLDVDRLDVPCVLRKPVLPDRLVEAVRSCLHGGAPGIHS